MNTYDVIIVGSGPAGLCIISTKAVMISSGSAMRPSSQSPHASSPLTGPTTRQPRSFKVVRLPCVAGLRHMPAFMAGARSVRFGS